MFPAKSFRGKKLALFGLARSGLACAEALRLGGAEVLAWDDAAVAVNAARAAGIVTTDLTQVDFTTLDGLVLSPGVPLTHPVPHWTVVKAKAAGIEIIGDTEILQREIAASGARMVAITGTNGKSTTTALIGHVLKELGADAVVGGNIGTAVFLMPEPRASRIYVLELSSFQIDLMPSLKPTIGILTNLTPDHLDRHGTMENYAAVKGRMFARQGKGDTALIGVDDEWCRGIFESLKTGVEKTGAEKTGAELRPVSVEEELPAGISAPDGVLHDRVPGGPEEVIDLRAMPALKGRHNWQNAGMAYGAAHALGFKTADIARAMMSFPGLAHRMQEIGRLGEIAFINDSKATNWDAAAKALASFSKIYWIAGGVPKAGGIEPLAKFFPRIAKAYLIGQAAPEFAATLEKKVAYEMSGTLDQAVLQAARDAVQDGATGAVVLLSPACASFDHYRNFELRGDAFVSAVAALPGVQLAQSVTVKGS